MNLKNPIYLIAFALCVVVLSCGDDDTTVDPTCATITYNSQVKPIIDASCAYSGCHDGVSTSVPGDYTSYSTLQSVLTGGQFKQRTLDAKDMPPVGAPGPASLTDAQLEILNCWHDQGYTE